MFWAYAGNMRAYTRLELRLSKPDERSLAQLLRSGVQQVRVVLRSLVLLQLSSGDSFYFPFKMRLIMLDYLHGKTTKNRCAVGHICTAGCAANPGYPGAPSGLGGVAASRVERLARADGAGVGYWTSRSEEHTSELQSR